MQVSGSASLSESSTVLGKRMVSPFAALMGFASFPPSVSKVMVTFTASFFAKCAFKSPHRPDQKSGIERILKDTAQRMTEEISEKEKPG